MKVAFLTLGCKVNYYETEKMMEQFRQKGFSVVDFDEPADIYIINTCTVTNIADRKSRQMIHRARKNNPGSYVVAVGCYVESGGDVLREDPAIDAAFSNKEKENLAERVIHALEWTHTFVWAEANSVNMDEQIPAERLSQERTRAYLKIQNGCNQFCSYCLIPFVRGKGRLESTPPEKVAAEVGRLAARGFKEVVLTGIHLSSYGIDGSDAGEFVRRRGEPLLSVIRTVSEVEGIRRIRLGSLEPRIISEEFTKKLSQIPELCPHFHLSLQSGCDSVLERMNRHYTTAEYREKVELLRRYFDHPAITTDIIVGFPGETEEEFEKTREYLRGLELADIHVFKYSPRTGTRAAAMEGQISPEIKNQRSDILIRDTKEYRRSYGESFLGKREWVLFEETVVEEGKEWLVGHNERYVKFGIPLEMAENNGYMENEIYEIPVEKIFLR